MRRHGHATAAAMVTILVMISTSSVSGLLCRHYQQATLSVLRTFVWPTSSNITVSNVLPREFAAAVKGRVVPLGVSSNTSLGALEYFYRLAGPLDPEDPITNRVSEANVRWMACDILKRQVAFECIFRLISPDIPANNYNISAMGVFTFNRAGKICAYDWDLRRLGLTIESYERNLIGGGGLAVYQDQVRLKICSRARTYCNGTNTQYTGVTACKEFLETKPFGDWDRADQDNVVCRSLHSLLVEVRPDVHCPHIGPDGGGKCVQQPITSLFTDDLAACAAV